MPPGMKMRRGPELPYTLLAGVVPCPRGWLVASGKLVGIQVHPEPPRVVKAFRDVLDNSPAYQVITVKVPIGLLTKTRRRGRKADEEARRILGFPHAGAIGSTPTRNALSKRQYDAARAANGGLLDVVTWGQFKRIREVDEQMEPYLQRQVFEVRPELSFYQLNENVPMRHTKNARAGNREREALLRRRMPGSETILDAELDRVRLTHLVDGAATLWTARRIVARAVSRLPEM